MVLVDDDDRFAAVQLVVRPAVLAYRGVGYEVDLSEKNAEKLDKVLAPYVAAARKVRGSRSPRVAARFTSGGPNPKDVREWARGEGIEVSNRGRVPADVIRQYQEAVGL